MTYKEKLIQWNSTEKYKSELYFLYSLLNPVRGQKIIDYGCGTGTAMKYIHFKSDVEVFGFDVSKDLYMWDEFYFRDEIYFAVDSVYFMHSIAHMQYPRLRQIKNDFLSSKGKVVVVTPNDEWLKIKNEGKRVVTDTTVVKHYNPQTLAKLFTDNEFQILQQGQFGECLNNQHERLFLIAK